MFILLIIFNFGFSTSRLRISAAGKHIGIQYLLHYWSDKGLNVCSFKIILFVPFSALNNYHQPAFHTHSFFIFYNNIIMMWSGPKLGFFISSIFCSSVNMDSTLGTFIHLNFIFCFSSSLFFLFILIFNSLSLFKYISYIVECLPQTLISDPYIFATQYCRP